MKLQFDPNQQFQLDAVGAVVDLFDGQECGEPDFSVIKTSFDESGLLAGLEQNELGIANQLTIDDSKLRENTRTVQNRNDIEVAGADQELEAWRLFDCPANRERHCPHFSVEMETGTGKTYVYLRTIFELSHRYGFQKFVIVVPSVAIREGVLKNIEITREHFRALYANLPLEYFVYDAKRINRLRQFATSNTLQILIINIDAFRKNFTGTETEQKSNVIYKESDKLSGRQPIEFVQAARPIVIIDEPQSVDSTDKAQEAIKALNPLCTLRYSATHRNPYNLVYRLDPIRAFDLRLVKQIVVASVTAEGAAAEPFVRVDEIEYKTGIKTKVRMFVKSEDGPKQRAVTLKQGDDLFVKSGELAQYAQGYEVAEIDATPDMEFIRFTGGKVLRKGDEIGGARADTWRLQIRKTIEEHLKKELRIVERGVKVLSLFFIDRVANYRDYDSIGKQIAGKFAVAFEEELCSLAKDSRFSGIEWLKLPAESLHNGYFASDKKGVLKDTRGDSQADDDAYNLIMKDKERLLSIDEPLRFIFSHSALREGWDNPNVFQICTLNETQSTVKKRQEIGRGLRLPVDQSGMRVRDDSVNRLYIMANESYESFAKALQTEYEEDCGVTFGKIPITAISRLTRVVDDEEKPIGFIQAEAIKTALVAQKYLDANGYLQPAFDPRRADFRLDLPDAVADMAPAVTDLLASYLIERHVQRDKSEGDMVLKKEVLESPAFRELWNRIKPKTTYRVEFKTEVLIELAVAAIKRLDKVRKPVLRYSAGIVRPSKGGVEETAIGVSEVYRDYDDYPIPDVLAYLQNETELTRSTLCEILTKSGRLAEFFNDPQTFMDQAAKCIKDTLHRLIVDGIKYERITGAGEITEWEQRLFANTELINYLTAQKVSHSVYDYVPYESEIEREFARNLDSREDIRLFMKLPSWFKIDTPLGNYNPDWAIVKHGDETVYLVRETKSTRDFLKLRTAEADKVRCGERHFEALGVPFAIAVTAADV
jgi:type III restriction enzyme